MDKRVSSKQVPKIIPPRINWEYLFVRLFHVPHRLCIVVFSCFLGSMISKVPGGSQVTGPSSCYWCLLVLLLFDAVSEEWTWESGPDLAFVETCPKGCYLILQQVLVASLCTQSMETRTLRVLLQAAIQHNLFSNC